MMKRLNIILSTVMKRDLKRVAKRGKPLEALYQVVTLLSEKQLSFPCAIVIMP